jgi:putative ABC transport system permease protein
MTAPLLRTMLAHWGQARTLTVLTILGVALGVASVVGIQTLNQGALAAFQGGVKAVSGDADLVVVGQGPDLDERLYAEVLAHREVAAAWPLVRLWAALADQPRTFLEIVGVDIFAPVSYPVRLTGEEGGSFDRFAGLLATPGWVALTPEFAAEQGLALGDPVAVAVGDRPQRLEVGALVDFRAHAPLASSRLALMDIAQAQHLAGRRGLVDQIDVQVHPGVDAARAAARLQRDLGPAVRVLTPTQREEGVAGLLAAFRLNLTALSLISVLVGMFLIFTAVHASLVRRRRHFGLIRSLGATSGQLLALILLEAGLLGLAGTLVGVPLGYLVARLNLAAVSATLTSIYLLSEIEVLRLSPWLVLLAAGVGLGGAVLGALLPALDVSRRDPVALLGAAGLPERLGRLAPRFALAAVTLAVLVLGWYLLAGRHLRESGFVLALGLMAVLPLLTPLVMREVCGRIPPGGFGWRLGLRGLASRLQATSFAVAALAVTVSMLIAVTVLIGSFRATLDTWLERSLTADIFATTASWQRDLGRAGLSPAVVDTLVAWPGVRAADLQRRLEAHTADGHPVRLVAFARLGEAPGRWASRLPLQSGDPDRVERSLREEGAVLITEPLARRTGLATGDTLVLAGPDGPVPLVVAGIGYDYSSEAGLVFMTRATLAGIYGPGPTGALALHLAPGHDAEAVLDAMRAAVGGSAIELRSNRRLRAEVLEIFDQTFAVTRILQVMTLVIAVCGVSLTLLIMGRERTTELALYRSLGATRRQLFRLGLSEGAGLGGLGLVLGAVGGAVLAAILILVINPAWFGWTIRFALPAPALVWQAVWILGGALLAAVWPALRASRTPIAELTREDLL